jgi:hypothetical protein
MTHGHAHEEAEHAQHHAHDPFDKRVAMTMVIVAAVLAAVKVLGHRTHNDTLSYQIAANVRHTKESDQWSYFQAKKNRQYLYEADADLLALLALRQSRAAAAADLLPRAEDALARLLVAAEAPAPEPVKKKKKGQLSAEDEKLITALVKKGLPRDAATRIVTWRANARRYRADADQIEAEARKLQKEALEYQKKSEHKHHQAFYFDMGELGVELALVLCSVAILSKQRGFWYGGIAVGMLGLVVVSVGFFIH